MISVGSLFAGIGGLELGLERAGLGPVRWQVESDPYCISVLAHHWPEAKRYVDVRSVGAHNLEAVDLICGGFPCQDISVAGSGEGLAGARSGLWSEYARIVRELRPRFVVVENVAALLGRGFGDVLGDLAALGYDAWWDCIPAAAVGAPHRRDRIFVVAWRVSDPERDRLRDEPERRAAARDVAHGHGLGRESERLAREQGRGREQGARGYVFDGCDLPQWPPAPDDVLAWRGLPAGAQPAICRLADGVLPLVLGGNRGASRGPALRALGNAVVPQVAEVVGAVVLELEATCRFGRRFHEVS